MALTLADVILWSDLKATGLLPARPRLLEIGQANWYGDIAPLPGTEAADPFEVARNFYDRMFGPSEVISIDQHGSPTALKLDLNEPLSIAGPFDIIINSGTAEHVFDQRRLFQSIHEQCAPGGLMVHAAPWQGWIHHGFYCYQPSFFLDLARANRYEVLRSFVWHVETKQAHSLAHDRLREVPSAACDTLLFFVFRKSAEGKFVVPWQGRYAKAGGHL